MKNIQSELQELQNELIQHSKQYIFVVNPETYLLYIWSLWHLERVSDAFLIEVGAGN